MPNDAVDHAARADALHAVLEDRFWSPRQRLFRVAEGRWGNPFGPWHHWWQSHALSALNDRFDRTGEERTRAQAYDVVEGMRARGGNRLTNDFYDDMGWLAIELFRLPGREADLDLLISAIRRGERAEGGIAWAVGHPEFRNTPATGPAAIVALRLAARTADAELGAWGLRLVRWLEDTLVSAEGDVADGFRIHPDGTTGVDQARYSYNYGVVVGAELAAFQVTSDESRLHRARQVAAAALRELTDPITGAWVSEGRGDRALFRGILARHLADLAQATNDTTLADAVRTQAVAVWDSCGGGSVGYSWPRRTDHRVELAEHVGGLLVIEAAARLG